MASTYTPNLNLEKPAHGDRVDDWDQVLNANADVLDAWAWRVPVRTDDPAAPAAGEQWIRSDLAELRVRIAGTTYAVSLAAV